MTDRGITNRLRSPGPLPRPPFALSPRPSHQPILTPPRQSYTSVSVSVSVPQKQKTKEWSHNVDIYHNSVLFHDVADRATFTSVPTTFKSSEDLLKEDNSPDPVVAEWIELFPLDLSSLLLHRE